MVKLRISPLTVFFYAISGLGMLVYKQTGYMCVGDIKKKKKESRRFVSTAGNEG